MVPMCRWQLVAVALPQERKVPPTDIFLIPDVGLAREPWVDSRS
jgi:hypothetical protein